MAKFRSKIVDLIEPSGSLVYTTWSSDFTNKVLFYCITNDDQLLHGGKGERAIIVFSGFLEHSYLYTFACTLSLLLYLVL